MNASLKRRIAFLAGTALVVFAVGVVCQVRARAAAARAVEGRRALRESFGIVSDGKSPFVALPASLVHDVRAARLGAELFSDYHVSRTPKCTCAACHWLNAGGSDGKVHGQTLTRSVVNSVFSSRFLKDGSLTNLTDVIQQMIICPEWADGDSPAQAARRLAKDPKMHARFKFAFAGAEPNATNLVYCLAQYLRTQVTTGRPLDLYEGGNTNALTTVQKRGRELFQSCRCLACHDGLALGGRKISEGRRVPALRGLTSRRVYLSDGSQTDLGAVLMLMPNSDLEDEDRNALLAFLRAL